MKIKNSLNANEFSKNYREIHSPSLTVPDQTMSIRTILERHSRGLPIGGRIDLYYDEDDDLPDPRTLDLAERQELVEQFKQEINEVNSRKTKSTIVDKSVDNSTENKTDGTES